MWDCVPASSLPTVTVRAAAVPGARRAARQRTAARATDRIGFMNWLISGGALGFKGPRPPLESAARAASGDEFGRGRQSSLCKRPIGVEVGKLIYAAIASLDGYVEDEGG